MLREDLSNNTLENFLKATNASSFPILLSEVEQNAHAELLKERALTEKEKRLSKVWKHRAEGFISGVFFAALAAALYALYWSK